MQITMIGHSTVLIESEGRKVLTDPYFGRWGNPAYARTSPPAKSREDLRDVDLVLISHNHWDHNDGRFLRSLAPDVPVLTPRWGRVLTRLRGAKSPQGMKAWEERSFGPISVTAVPAVHIAAAIGFVIESEGKQVYFSGDTYYRPFMRQVGRRFRLDAALIPVTTFRIPMTMGEKGAVRAARDLEAPFVIPIHLGVRPRHPLLRTNHTPENFARRVAVAGLPTEVIVLREGQSFVVPSRERMPQLDRASSGGGR